MLGRKNGLMWRQHPFFRFRIRFRFGHRLLHPLSFSCRNYVVSSVSVSAETRLAYDMHLDTYVWYADLAFQLFFWGIRFVSVYCGYYLPFFTCFSSWGFLPLKSYWSLSCDHGLHCSDELMWQQQLHNCSGAQLYVFVFKHTRSNTGRTTPHHSSCSNYTSVLEVLWPCFSAGSWLQ